MKCNFLLVLIKLFSKWNKYILVSGAGDSFRRRMSLASLGTRKYGRAGVLNNYSDGGVTEENTFCDKVLVEHIPIVIEADESYINDKDPQTKETIPTVPEPPNVKPSISWQIADDRLSLSSLSSDNSIESSRRKDKDNIVRAWMTNCGDDRSHSSYQSLENWSDMVRKGRGGNGWENSIKRKPFSDITHVGINKYM